eukprot:Lankesteria_metandrocarpae@DN6145_c0_g1_i1.p1
MYKSACHALLLWITESPKSTHNNPASGSGEDIYSDCSTTTSAAVGTEGKLGNGSSAALRLHLALAVNQKRRGSLATHYEEWDAIWPAVSAADLLIRGGAFSSNFDSQLNSLLEFRCTSLSDLYHITLILSSPDVRHLLSESLLDCLSPIAKSSASTASKGIQLIGLLALGLSSHLVSAHLAAAADGDISSLVPAANTIMAPSADNKKGGTVHDSLHYDKLLVPPTEKTPLNSQIYDATFDSPRAALSTGGVQTRQRGVPYEKENYITPVVPATPNSLVGSAQRDSRNPNDSETTSVSVEPQRQNVRMSPIYGLIGDGAEDGRRVHTSVNTVQLPTSDTTSGGTGNTYFSHNRDGTAECHGSIHEDKPQDTMKQQYLLKIGNSTVYDNSVFNDVVQHEDLLSNDYHLFQPNIVDTNITDNTSPSAISSVLEAHGQPALLSNQISAYATDTRMGQPSTEHCNSRGSVLLNGHSSVTTNLTNTAHHNAHQQSGTKDSSVSAPTRFKRAPQSHFSGSRHVGTASSSSVPRSSVRASNHTLLPDDATLSAAVDAVEIDVAHGMRSKRQLNRGSGSEDRLTVAADANAPKKRSRLSSADRHTLPRDGSRSVSACTGGMHTATSKGIEPAESALPGAAGFVRPETRACASVQQLCSYLVKRRSCLAGGGALDTGGTTNVQYTVPPKHDTQLASGVGTSTIVGKSRYDSTTILVRPCLDAVDTGDSTNGTDMGLDAVLRPLDSSAFDYLRNLERLLAFEPNLQDSAELKAVCTDLHRIVKKVLGVATGTSASGLPHLRHTSFSGDNCRLPETRSQAEYRGVTCADDLSMRSTSSSNNTHYRCSSNSVLPLLPSSDSCSGGESDAGPLVGVGSQNNILTVDANICLAFIRQTLSLLFQLGLRCNLPHVVEYVLSQVEASKNRLLPLDEITFYFFKEVNSALSETSLHNRLSPKYHRRLLSLFLYRTPQSSNGQHYVPTSTTGGAHTTGGALTTTSADHKHATQKDFHNRASRPSPIFIPLIGILTVHFLRKCSSTFTLPEKRSVLGSLESIFTEDRKDNGHVLIKEKLRALLNNEELLK